MVPRLSLLIKMKFELMFKHTFKKVIKFIIFTFLLVTTNLWFQSAILNIIIFLLVIYCMILFGVAVYHWWQWHH